MARDTQYNEFVEKYDGRIKRNELMSAHTTFRTGGNADLYTEATNVEQLAEAIKIAREMGIPFFVIGEGSNLLVGDVGFRGLIIRNLIRRLEVKGTEILAGAGEHLDRAVDYASECSLTGLEFAAGIWGTVGGAVYGNAGAFGSQVGSVLGSADLIDMDGDIRTESQDYFGFTYRNSKLKKTREIVTEVRFSLEHGNKSKIESRVNEIRQLRGHKHPLTPCSAGCFFKNIEDMRQPGGKLAAGKLLDDIGAKEISIGDAAVFEKHANIIVNRGSARSKDIRQLADILKEKVKLKFDIELQEEVISLGEF
jgi:UDP-N-acetylmuramate dehydrogenase